MRPRFRLGLRTLKTALSVMLSLYIASWFGELSIFPALASVSVMSRTFDEGLKECRNQAVGIFIGGLFGCLTVYWFPSPPIWLMSLGVMVIIFVCASFNVGFSCSLSCAIFIVACMTDKSDVLRNVLIRCSHTAIGLGVGLAINYLVVPYNNSKKIYELQQEITDLIPDYLNKRIFQDLYPDLTPMNNIFDRLEYELTLYRHQRAIHQRMHRDEYSYMTGCAQLAERIRQELTALCSIERIGQPDQEQFLRLRCIGLQINEPVLSHPTSSEEDNIVTNYHLKKLLDCREYLLQLLAEKDNRPNT